MTRKDPTPGLVNLAAEARLDETITLAHQAQAGYVEDRDLVNQLLGQAQMANASEEFFRTVRTSKLAFIKENKLYRALAGQKIPHGAENLTGTWQEFCNLMGRSVDQVDRDIDNLNAFGEAALENMTRIGIGYRDMRKLRKLPADVREEVVQGKLVDLTDREEIVALIDDLAAKHAREKAALEAASVSEKAAQSKVVDELRATLVAKDRVIGQQAETIVAEKETVARLLHKQESATPDEVRHELYQVLIQDVEDQRLTLNVLEARAAKLLAHGEETDTSENEVVAGLLRQLAADVLAAAERLGVDVGAEDFSWATSAD